jgi:hypothetical protein
MYSQPPANALDFVLSRQNYVPPPAGFVDFDLASDGPSQVDFSPVPGVIASVSTPWNPRPATKQSSLSFLFQQARKLDIQRAGATNQASVLADKYIAGRHSEASELSRTIAANWDRSIAAREATLTAIAGAAKQKDIEARSAPWAIASVLADSTTRSSFLINTPWKDRQMTGAFHSVQMYRPLWLKTENKPEPFGPVVQGIANLEFYDRKNIRRPDAFEIGSEWENNPIQPKDLAWTGRHGNAPVKDIDSELPWGPAGFRDTTINAIYPDYNGPINLPGEPVYAEEKGTYYIMNTVNVKRVSDNTPLDIQNITIGLDVDSWAWRFSGTVIGLSSLSLIEPTGSGLIDIEVELNGYIWIFMIESYSGNRKHADQRFTVVGVSRTQLLASPYSDQQSKVYTSSILADQIINDELLNTGFSVTWSGLISWSVDADAFSYQNMAPIAVAKRIAEAAGAVLIPARDTDDLTLQPRIRISPWSLDAEPLTSIDAQIPMAMVTNLSMRYQPAALYDSVYVSGTNTGVATLVTLTGTGGTAPAPDVFDDLMTDTDVTTERARQDIAGSGGRSLYTMTLPIPEFTTAPGLVEPGMVVEIVEAFDTWRGYVLGTTITAPRSGAAKIEQQIQIVRFYEHNG